jgi:hypothetical protein
MSFDRPEDIEDVGGESDVGGPETEPELDQPESEPETEPEQADS